MIRANIYEFQVCWSSAYVAMKVLDQYVATVHPEQLALYVH